MRAVIAAFALLLSVNVAADTDEGGTSRYKKAFKMEANFNAGVAAYRAGDYKTALKWLTEGAKQGHAKAQVGLGLMYASGRRVPQDYKEAVKWYTKAAEQGNADAQNSLGFMYANGQGVPQDYKEAVKWYTKAAEQGHAKAQYNLGGMYGDGQGVPQDNVYAHMWANVASSNGYKIVGKLRDRVAKSMTPEQIAEAQRLARECVKKSYKDC